MRIPLPKLRELKEAITSLLSKPYTIDYPAKPSPAFPRYRGRPVYDEKACMGCGACAQVCPAKTIEVEDDKNTRTLLLRYDVCQYCGQCQYYCPTEKGITLTQDYEIAGDDRKLLCTKIEKELIRCNLCGEVITAVDHLRWLVKKLGILTFTNPNLLLMNQLDLGLIKELAKKPEKEPLRRADNLRIVCPSCRREVFLKEEWGF
jgi:hydrogenase-4 component H